MGIYLHTEENMIPAISLKDKVLKTRLEDIELPILRDLVEEIQTKSNREIYEETQNWRDSDFSQWREHSSHNPW